MTNEEKLKAQQELADKVADNNRKCAEANENLIRDFYHRLEGTLAGQNSARQQ